MSRFAVLAAALLAAPLSAQVDARLMREPDVSATHIVFVYAGDLWIVPKAGGTAQRLSSPPGEEQFPRFSPDGSHIAYSADYDGNTDVYVIPTEGGTPVRVTHHPMADRLVDWFPNGTDLLIASSMASGRQRFNQLYRVSAQGGLPRRLPMPYGEFGAVSPDGNQIAYMPKSRDFRTWKRYRGGWAPDIWMFNLRDSSARNLTNNAANDAHPMWHGNTLYFLSDRGPQERYNIWAMDANGGQPRQVTHFTDYDITFPAVGPNDIVFEAGGRLHLLSLSDEQVHDVNIQVVTDLATIRPRTENVGDLVMGATLGPQGERAILEARGDLFSLPAEHGPVINLTQSSGVAERYPSWSPDGQTVAYWSDRSGEYQLTLRPAAGGAERTVSRFGPGFRYHIWWSPDSKKVAWVDQTMTIRMYDLDANRTTDVDQGLYLFEGGLENFHPSWSPDSRWLAWSRSLDNQHGAIFLYDTQARRKYQATSGYYGDNQPVFDPDGKYLYFFSNRTLNPDYSDVDNTWIYANTTNIVAASLRPDVPSPLAPRNDVEVRDSAQADSSKAVVVDGLENRAVVLPMEAGNYTDLAAASGKVIYRRLPRTGAGRGTDSPIVYWDLQDRSEKVVLDDADDMIASPNGTKLLVRQGRRLAIIETKPNQKFAHPLRTGEMTAVVDPRAEWRQLFTDAWRFERDFFYDPNMHGVDWNAMRQRYGTLVDQAVTRWDVNFAIGELIAELSSSHTYRGGGDLEQPMRRDVGLLGVDWTLANGAYRIAHIVRGAPWDVETRSPLDQPDVDVHEGDYVLAVNGTRLDPATDPWTAFAGLADVDVQLTVNNRPTMDGARTVLVHTLNDETRLRHLEWIEANRRRVDEASHGRVGYIYVPSTGVDGQTELLRQFNAQFTKDALIIDERFNSGGQIPDRFIEMLDRQALVFWAVRDGKDWQWPPVGNFGPKVMLINGWSGSGGDAFPYYFKERHIGPLVGERTWGGLIGVSGAPPLIDGGGVTVPTFRQYSPDGQWFPEGHGVEPDIPVVDDPAQLARGVDPQLERAIQEAMHLLETNPPVRGHRPPYQRRVPGGDH